jgi:hypothetical protein
MNPAQSTFLEFTGVIANQHQQPQIINISRFPSTLIEQAL